MFGLSRKRGVEDFEIEGSLMMTLSLPFSHRAGAPAGRDEFLGIRCRLAARLLVLSRST